MLGIVALILCGVAPAGSVTAENGAKVVAQPADVKADGSIQRRNGSTKS